MLKGFSNVLLISTVFFATTLSACSSGQEVASLKLPNGMEVKHSRTRTHPGFSEYDRELVLLDGVGKSKKLLLEKDTSGGYPMNVHGDKSGRYLRISDALIFDYVIDLKEMKGYSTMKFGDVLYAGDIDNKTSDGELWGEISITIDGVKKTEVTAYGRPAVPLSQIVDLASVTDYIGRFEGKDGRLRFVPASESPEIPIQRNPAFAEWERDFEQ